MYHGEQGVCYTTRQKAPRHKMAPFFLHLHTLPDRLKWLQKLRVGLREAKNTSRASGCGVPNVWQLLLTSNAWAGQGRLREALEAGTGCLNASIWLQMYSTCARSRLGKPSELDVLERAPVSPTPDCSQQHLPQHIYLL